MVPRSETPAETLTKQVCLELLGNWPGTVSSLGCLPSQVHGIAPMDL